MRRLALALVLTPTLVGAQASARFDVPSGLYEVTDDASGWRLAGKIEGARNVRCASGEDRLGAYSETSFEWTDGVPVRGTIRAYGSRRIVKFDLTYLDSKEGRAVVFPRFTDVPKDLAAYSFRGEVFAPGGPGLATTGTPWLRFDDRGRALVFSPANQFMTAKMLGGPDDMGVGMNDKLEGVPKGTDQASLIAFADGINRAWNVWGGALRTLYGRKLPANDKGAILRDYGYWTDNGGDYYYNYERELGYAGTMLAVRDHYRKLGLSLGYFQIDSWWYDKTLTSPSGRTGTGSKNPKLPEGLWNRYGGAITYRANADLFPNGFAAFQRALGLPLVVHGRWIDPTSPYHKDYKISGIAPIDPKWWNETAAYLKASGVSVYEQDWLDEIYNNSPELINRIGVADQFTGNMAKAADANGLDLQYCMGLPKHFLQGLQYPNLTTIRTSHDRFLRARWAHFFNTSALAREIGAYPWVDVFKSGETGNLTIALLSAGPVGTGDAIGKENPDNIRRAARPDGVLIKADTPAVPCDLTYLNLAAGRKAPFLAATSAGTARLLFAFADKDGEKTLDIKPEDVGVTVTSYLYDPLTGTGRRWSPGETATLDAADYAYRIVAPFTRTGIVLLGDLDKIVPTGRARIGSVKDQAEGLRVTVAFAKGEPPVTLTVVSPHSPRVTARRGAAKVTGYDPTTDRATILVSGQDRAEVTIDGRG